MTVNKDESLAIKRYVRGLGPVGYKLGEEMRPTLDGSDAPGRFGLSEAEVLDINRHDPVLWTEICRKQSMGTTSCVSGMRSFHIDPYGHPQPCPGNRQTSYDPRRRSLSARFSRRLPT